MQDIELLNIRTSLKSLPFLENKYDWIYFILSNVRIQHKLFRD